jgi:hypothetical protein
LEWIIGLIILWILSAIFGGSKDESDTTSNTSSKTSVHHKPIAPPDPEITIDSQQFTQKNFQELAKKHPHPNKGQPSKKLYKQTPEQKTKTDINDLLNQIDSENEISNLLKNDWKSIVKILVEHKITNLYHFTDQDNIQSIKKMGGLYSWKELEGLSVNIPAQGGNDLSKRLDTYKQLENYVRLSFVEKTPMLYLAQQDCRIRTPILLKIDPIVTLLKDTLYSDGNAIANKAQIGGGVNDFEKINFNIFQKGRWKGDEEKHYWQAEIMVKKFIPLKFIKNLPA